MEITALLAVALIVLFGACRALDRMGAFQGLLMFIVVALLWVFVLPLGAFVTLFLALSGMLPEPRRA
jgi:Na+/proline symporter